MREIRWTIVIIEAALRGYIKIHVVFKVTCMDCKYMGKVTEYYGESARATYDRLADHYRALQSCDTNNPLVEHWVKDHPDKAWDFQMKVVKMFRSPLQRQACEGYLISTFK